DAVLKAIATSDDDAVSVLSVFRCCQLGADTKQRGQRSAGEDAIPMPVGPILQAGVAGRVGADQIIQRQRTGVRQDDAVPHHLHAALPVADLAVVTSKYPRTLRDE